MSYQPVRMRTAAVTSATRQLKSITAHSGAPGRDLLAKLKVPHPRKIIEVTPSAL